ncbi:MAG: diaminopimelate epimerase [Eubacteriales bacterium]|nr:diaminopimelate epimerase [Eubacteriales bacterium]
MNNNLKNIIKMNNSWFKGHGLGNDYIVFDSAASDINFDKQNIIKICDRHFGIGSDGILLKVKSKKADFGLKIFNPDGSEAEKSGNGLRIFADYLFSWYTSNKSFTVEVGNQIVRCEIISSDDNITNVLVDIGRAIFDAKKVPVICADKEAIDIPINIANDIYKFSMVSIGNPHAVCVTDDINNIDIKKIGPEIENHNLFPNRINVQIAQVSDIHNVDIRIWERGAGYTLASGSSSCAVASVLYKKGLIDNNVKIHSPGGCLEVLLDEKFNLKLLGPVEKVACGVLICDKVNKKM